MDPLDQAAGRIRVRCHAAATADGTNQYALVPGEVLVEEFSTLEALAGARAGRGTIPLGIVVVRAEERERLARLVALPASSP